MNLRRNDGRHKRTATFNRNDRAAEMNNKSQDDRMSDIRNTSVFVNVWKAGWVREFPPQLC